MKSAKSQRLNVVSICFPTSSSTHFSVVAFFCVPLFSLIRVQCARTFFRQHGADQYRLVRLHSLHSRLTYLYVYQAFLIILVFAVDDNRSTREFPHKYDLYAKVMMRSSGRQRICTVRRGRLRLYALALIDWNRYRRHIRLHRFCSVCVRFWAEGQLYLFVDRIHSTRMQFVCVCVWVEHLIKW